MRDFLVAIGRFRMLIVALAVMVALYGLLSIMVPPGE